MILWKMLVDLPLSNHIIQVVFQIIFQFTVFLQSYIQKTQLDKYISSGVLQKLEIIQFLLKLNAKSFSVTIKELDGTFLLLSQHLPFLSSHN